MEPVVERENMARAYRRVVANGGAPGVDKMPVDALLPHLTAHWARIKEELLEGRYTPQPVRIVEIPKPSGGVRMLGIPTCLDRLIQQGLQQVLTPIFDPDKELERRDHAFCRYADDCNIYVGSKAAGERVMASLTRFLEKKLRLKVNAVKSDAQGAAAESSPGISAPAEREPEGPLPTRTRDEHRTPHRRDDAEAERLDCLL